MWAPRSPSNDGTRFPCIGSPLGIGFKASVNPASAWSSKLRWNKAESSRRLWELLRPRGPCSQIFRREGILLRCILLHVVSLFCCCVNVFIHVWLKTMHTNYFTLWVDQESGHSLAEMSASRSYRIVFKLSVRTKVSMKTGLRSETLQNSFGLCLEFIFLWL